MIDLAFIPGFVRTHARAAGKARSNTIAIIAGSPPDQCYPIGRAVWPAGSLEKFAPAAEKAGAKTGGRRAPARLPLSLEKTGLPVAQHFVVAGAAAAGAVVLVIGRVGLAADLATR